MPAPPRGPGPKPARPSGSPSGTCPSPKAPARDITEVSALVASATDSGGTLGTVPRAFKKPPMPAAKSLLDTGSLVSLHGSLQAAKVNQPAQDRKAG